MGFIDLFVTIVNSAAQEKLVRAAHERARRPPVPWGMPPAVLPGYGQSERFPPAWRQVMAVERDEGRLRVVNHREYQWLDPIAQAQQQGWGNMVVPERFDTRGPSRCPCNNPGCPNA